MQSWAEDVFDASSFAGAEKLSHFGLSHGEDTGDPTISGFLPHSKIYIYIWHFAI